MRQRPCILNLHNAHPRSVCFVSWSKVWLSISHEMQLWYDLPTVVVLYSLSMQVMSLLVVSDEVAFREQTAVQLDPGTTWRVRALEGSNESKEYNRSTVLSGHGQRPEEAITVPIAHPRSTNSSRHHYLHCSEVYRGLRYPAICQRVLDEHI